MTRAWSRAPPIRHILSPVARPEVQKQQYSLGLIWGLRVALRIVRQPSLALTAARQALSLAPRRWWRAWPPLPLPAADYMHFRSVTAYGGDGERPPDPDDVADWLQWVKAWPSVTTEGRNFQTRTGHGN